jgi:hypothetical protein
MCWLAKWSSEEKKSYGGIRNNRKMLAKDQG